MLTLTTYRQQQTDGTWLTKWRAGFWDRLRLLFHGTVQLRFRDGERADIEMTAARPERRG